MSPSSPATSSTTSPAETTLFTRQDYMAKRCTFEQYYGQYVSPAVIRVVRQRIGEKAILASQDPHLNDIPLKQWDDLHDTIRTLSADMSRRLHPRLENPKAFVWSLSDTVCVAKTAARHIQQESLKQNLASDSSYEAKTLQDQAQAASSTMNPATPQRTKSVL